MLIGQDAWSGAAFCYDPWELYRQGALTNPNICLAGQIGRGKSTLAKSLATRCIAFGRRVYVPGDPKGEWTVVTRALGGQADRARRRRSRPASTLSTKGPGRSRLDDSDLAAAGDGPAPRAARRPGRGHARPATAGDRAHRARHRSRERQVPVERPGPAHGRRGDARPGAGRPAGSSIEQLRTDGREAAHALARLVRGDLAGLFDGPSTVRFDPGLPMLSLDLSAISGSDTLIGLVMTCASTWMEAALADPAGGQRLVVYDEAWRLLAQPALLARMQAQWKLSRALGLANLMVVHRLSDLDAVGDTGSEARGLAQGLLGDTATRILYNEPFDEAKAAARCSA